MAGKVKRELWVHEIQGENGEYGPVGLGLTKETAMGEGIACAYREKTDARAAARIPSWGRNRHRLVRYVPELKECGICSKCGQEEGADRLADSFQAYGWSLELTLRDVFSHLRLSNPTEYRHLIDTLARDENIGRLILKFDDMSRPATSITQTLQ